MNMKFDETVAIENALLVVKNFEDFYRTYTGEASAAIKIEDGFFILAQNGFIKQEFNKEGYNQQTQPDQTFVEDICNLNVQIPSDDAIREKIRLFLYNIPPTGS